MTKILHKFTLSALVVCLFPLGVFAQDVETATTTSGLQASPTWYTVERLLGVVNNGDFVVGPGRTEINLQPGDTHTAYISIANRISDNRTFKIEVVDITGSSDGSSALNLVETGRGPYSILDYISFPEDTLTLGLGERALVPITLSLPLDAEPGGYYGRTLVSTVQSDEDSATHPPPNPITPCGAAQLLLTYGG